MRVALTLALAGLCAGPAQACWQEVGQKYGIHPYLLYAIAKTESGLNPRALNHNANGTRDVGLMQINSSWLPALAKHGITEQQLYEPCVNLDVGAWILADNMRRLGATWTAVGAYNASTPHKQLEYALRVYRNLEPAFQAAARESNDAH
jgi:soluble lytic murein transglycosylase-like protein